MSSSSRTPLNSTLEVSRACLGTMTFGSQVDELGARAMVDLCFDRGVDFFDTANVYNDGQSEVILGKCLKGRRHQAVVASKVRMRTGLSRAAILKAVEESLTRLGTDRLDIYYLHAPDNRVSIEETLAAMDTLVKQGKILYPAISNYSAWETVKLLWVAKNHGYRPITISQPMYNLLARGIEQEYLPMCRDFQITTCVYNPLAGGLLTGKHTSAAPLAGSRFDNNQQYQERYWHQACFDAVARLEKIAADARRSMVSVALGWLQHHSATDCIILGASRLEHLRQNLDAMDEGMLLNSTEDGCNDVWRSLRGVTPQYNR